MATIITDSPISKLSEVVQLSSEDLLLVSKWHKGENGNPTYTSNRVNVHDMVSSFIDYMAGPLSSYLSTHISSLVGTITLKEWTYIPPNG